MDFSVKESPGSPRVSYLGVNLNPFSFLNEYKLRERNIKHFGQYAFSCKPLLYRELFSLGS